jgi:toxin YoeB
VKVTFSGRGWTDYLFWQGQDRRTLKRINVLIADAGRENDGGIGKPELLSGNLAGWWSRRIDEQHRLVYRTDGDGHVEVAQCRYHYGDH